jgi:hypothetical protein
MLLNRVTVPAFQFTPKPYTGPAKADTPDATSVPQDLCVPISSDMADMVDNIRAANARDQAQADPQPPIKAEAAPVTPRPSAPSQPIVVNGRQYQAGPSSTATNSNNPTTLMSLDQPAATGAASSKEKHEHVHNQLLNHTFLAAHIGLDGLQETASQASEAGGGMAADATTAADVLNPNTTWDIAKDAVVEGGGHLAHTGLSAGLTAAVSGGMVAAGGLGVAMLAIGARQIKTGMAEKNKEEILEGTNSTLVGVRSALSTVVMSGLVDHSELLETVAHGAEAVLTPLGVIHGAIDAGLGVKDVIVGLKHHDGLQQVKGYLGVGLGTCLAAAALGGGIPCLVAAGAFVGARVVEHVMELKRERDENSQETAKA